MRAGAWVWVGFSLIFGLILGLGFGGPAEAQTGLEIGEVTVGVERSGRGSGDETPWAGAAEVADRLRVVEGGEERPVLEVEQEGRPWRLVVYLDAALSDRQTLPRATRALEALTRELVELGTVEIVLAEERPRRLLAPSRDLDQVAAALARANLMERGGDALVELRREMALELETTATPEQARSVARQAVAREATLVQSRLDLLLGYLVETEGAPGETDSRRSNGPTAVLWVGDGFDLDPAIHWRDRPGLADFEVPEAADGLKETAEEWAESLAGLGWTVVPVSLRRVELEEWSRWGVGEFRRPDGTSQALPRVTLGGGSAEKRAEEALRREAGPPPVPVDPDTPLLAAAESTGGRFVTSLEGFQDTLGDLASRLRLRFPSVARAGGTDPLVPLRVTVPGSDLRIRARGWRAAGTPRAVSALRARRLLEGELDPGRVTVRAALGLESDTRAQFEVRVEPAPGPDGGVIPPGPRRLTIATQSATGGPPQVTHRVVTGKRAGAEVEAAEGAPADAAAALDRVAAWSYRDTLDLPPGTERVAVVVEEPGADGALAAGSWGGMVAGIYDTRAASARPEDGVYDVATGLLPGPRPVSLLRPQGDMLTGPVVFETAVTPGVGRVDFHVDGRRRQRVLAPPFTARLDLGRLPELRRVLAVAYDADGKEVGRDQLVINGGGGRLRVRISEPAESRAVGTVDVAADVEVPEGASLDRVELFWRDRLAATLFQGPFRHRLAIAADDPEGYLRAVVYLADGSRAEDVLYLNGPVAGDRIDVRLTELYVVVTGRDGRPVQDLTVDDFVVRENGERQRVETFSDAGDLPITIGLAIDSSASMFVKLPEVQEAAAEFLAELQPGRDRAFLVDFDDEVRLAAATTGELADVRQAGFGLQPGGQTSLWQAVVYSLVQLQSAPGRKALVIYSDGADEDHDFPFRDALAFARKVAVPIYVIVSNDEAVRTGGIPIGFPSLGRRLQKLTEATGGRVWLVRRGDDLADVYRQIEKELSAQYLLGYYPDTDGLVNGFRDWRRVEVDALGRGLEARTLAGYQR